MATKYDRIAADLRRRIQAGELRPGQRLRPETELMEEYGVSLNTLRRGLDLLEAEGLIEKHHGTGNFVREMRQRTRRTTDRYQWEKDRVHLPEEARRADGAVEQDTGLTADDFVFQAEYETVAADDDLAEAFGVEVGTRLLKRVYRTKKRAERAPLGLATSYLLYDMLTNNPALLDAANEPWPGGTQHQLSTIGIEIDRITDEVTARPPMAEEAEELDIGPGISVLCARKISIDTENRVVEVVDIVWPGDRMKLTYCTTLKRWN